MKKASVIAQTRPPARSANKQECRKRLGLAATREDRASLREEVDVRLVHNFHEREVFTNHHVVKN